MRASVDLSQTALCMGVHFHVSPGSYRSFKSISVFKNETMLELRFFDVHVYIVFVTSAYMRAYIHIPVFF